MQPKARRDYDGIRRIVAAYNESPPARRALATAVRLAREGYGAELFAVAVEQRLLLTGDTIAEVQDVHATRERTCAGWLSAALAYADEHGVELRTEIRIGLVAQQLVGAAAAHQADLLILGRHPPYSYLAPDCGRHGQQGEPQLSMPGHDCPVMVLSRDEVTSRRSLTAPVTVSAAREDTYSLRKARCRTRRHCPPLRAI